MMKRKLYSFGIRRKRMITTLVERGLMLASCFLDAILASERATALQRCMNGVCSQIVMHMLDLKHL